MPGNKKTPVFTINPKNRNFWVLPTQPRQTILTEGINNSKPLATREERDFVNLLAWTRRYRYLKGKPFSFENRPYLRELYTKEDWMELNIVKPRQMEMTEFALNWLLYNLTKHPHTVGLYMSDRQDHVGIFSNLRLQSGAMGGSTDLAALGSPDHNVSHQPFSNYSHLYMLSAWGDFEAARSIPVDFAVVDEMQSVNVEALPVLQESMSKSRFKKLIKIGTGSDEGDDWWKEWHTGTPYIWDPSIKDDKGFTVGGWVQKPGFDYVPGRLSYQLNQKMAIWILPDEIEFKRKKYTPRRFANEVEGWWYKGMRRPLTAQEMMNLFDRNLDLTTADKVNHTLPIYAGFDWGGGTQAHTVAWIWQLVNENVPRFKLLHLEKLDDPSTENQADRAIELIRRFEVDQVVMDAGGGTRQVEKVSKTFGSRVFKVNYRYDAANPIEIFRKEHRLNCDRTWIIETIIDLIKRPEPSATYPSGIPRIHLPYKDPEKIEWIIDNFTCIEAETSSAGGKEFVKYIHPESMPDDALHAAGYAYMAWVVHQGAGWSWVRFG